MKNWKDYFDKKILDRGRIYYRNGAVRKLRETDTGYTAIVSGTERYSVEIDMQNGEIEDMFCDCPYADSGENCKHMAAVLYEIEAKQLEANGQEDKKKKAKREEKQESLKDIIYGISEAELRYYVYTLAKSNKSIENYIRINYGQKINPDYIKELKKDLRDIIRKYRQDGFIDWYSAGEYINEIEDFMENNIQGLIERNFLMEAFELTNYVLDKVGNQPMDDSGGELVMMASDCEDYWQEIIEKVDDKNKDKIFKCFKMQLIKHRLEDFVDDVTYEFFMKNFQEEKYLIQKIEVLNSFIKEVEIGNSNAEYFYHLKCNCAKYISKRLEIMQKLNYTDEKIKAYEKEYWVLPEIRKIVLNDYMSRGNLTAAIEILQESKKFDREYFGLVASYSRKLMELYKRTGDKKAYRQELVEYIFDNFSNDMDAIHKLKEDCTQEEWFSYRNKILSGKVSRSLKLELMKEEGLYEELLNKISERDDIHELDKYEDVLKKRFPEKVRDLYIEYIKIGQQRVSDREMYRDLIRYLKKVTLYPDGEAKAAEIAANWRDIYKRRRAMMDELNEAGF